MTSIFDSKAEQQLFHTIRRRWSRKVEVFSQVSCRAVLKHDYIAGLNLPARARDYLHRADFDFVVCETGTCRPLLIVEFDGIGGGFSSDGRYHPQRGVPGDPYRRLKLERKLFAAEAAGIPMIVLSFDETVALTAREQSATVLDAVIAEIVAAPLMYDHVAASVDAMLRRHPDASREMVQDLILEAEVDAEFKHHQIVRATLRLCHGLPDWAQGAGMAILSDRPGWCGARHWIGGGFELSARGARARPVVLSDLYIRDLHAGTAHAATLVQRLGEYCLYSKAVALLGTDPAAWAKAVDSAEWRDVTAL